jgi:2-polyprenyl-6-methoxyphenol hydroxylase-like FAD-dependent oxidoreductase
MFTPTDGHAVVCGAGAAGLFAAKVLADHYETVTIVERDQVCDATKPRKGVPQGSHIHGILLRGGEIMEDLFPGLFAELFDDGAVRAAFLSEIIYQYLGHRLYPAVTGHEIALGTRPFLEAHLRQRVLARDNVRLLEGHEVTDVVGQFEGRVTGVRITPSGHTKARTLDAALVVEALGRSGRAAVWLQRMGYAAPKTEQLNVGVRYVSCLYRLAAEARKGFPAKALYLGPQPHDRRALVMSAQENDLWILSLAGYDSFVPPTDQAGLLAAVRELSPDEAYPMLTTAEPVTAVSSYRFSGGHRRRYERLAHHPEGLVSTGDSICALNPLYGTGITVAAELALLLGSCLQVGENDLPRRFYKGAAKVVRPPWLMTTISDRVLNPPPFRRDPLTRFNSLLIRRAARAAARSPKVATTLIEAITMVISPLKVAHPRVLAEILFG